MDNDMQREAFERWISEDGEYTDRLRRDYKGDYASYSTYAQWQVWQAAQAELAELREERWNVVATRNAAVMRANTYGKELNELRAIVARLRGPISSGDIEDASLAAYNEGDHDTYISDASVAGALNAYRQRILEG